MNQHILIAYASKCGSTEEAAREIGKVLAENGAKVDILPGRKVRDVSKYDFVVIGTAIRIGKPLKEAIAFAEKFRAELRGKPLALFSLGLQMREDSAENREKAQGFLAPVISVIGEPVSVGLFGGKIDRSRFGFFLRMFAKMEKTGVFNEGDWRNWEKIRTWAMNLRNT